MAAMTPHEPQSAADYDDRTTAAWLFDKVSTTLGRVESGVAKLHDHDEAMSLLRERLKARLAHKRV